MSEEQRCEECGGKVERKPNQRGRYARFCSRRCQVKALNRKPHRQWNARS